ncbi:hypothetical protein BKH46_06670 [Helicobacter sp. 12S02634-8]|nr:hypothetical protein BKH46_06670 [Helicobacter sp. 12S02634-8]
MAKRSIIYQGYCFDIAYKHINNHQEKNMVFLHGWGSNKELMLLAFGGVFKDFNHYYIDLPGFGDSPNDKVLSTNDYSKIIDLFLHTLGVRADIITGHSFGGKVALGCKNDAMILLSAAGILTPKSWKVRIKILLAKILKICKFRAKFLRSADAHALNEAMYQVFKQVVSEDFAPFYKQCKKKVTIFWGEEDKATPLSSGQKIASLIADNRFFVLKGDHFFFLKQGKIIDEKYHFQGIIAMKTIIVHAKGKVQGVGYRKFCQAKALELNITGTAQNLADGSVEVYAQGSDIALKAFIDALKKGPSKAAVTHLEYQDISSRDFDQFKILV